jgi:outer membrane lipoprotein-sorting protein
MIAFSFHGCNKAEQSGKAQDRLHTMLKTLKGYETDATITFLKDTQINIIKMKQAVEIGGKYKLILESPDYLKGYTTTFDGENIFQYNPHTKENVACKQSEARNQILLSSFIHNYVNTQELKQGNDTLDGKEVIVCEVNIPGDYKYMAKEKVWFDKRELWPIKMEIYDIQGNLAIQVEFSHFKPNTQIKF